MYKLGLHKKASKNLKRITKGDRTYAEKIADAIRDLAETPTPTGVTALGLDMYRIRVGAYRIIYAVFQEENYIVVGKIARRSEGTYSDLSELTKQTKAELAKLLSQK